jgi:hypothetical protein
LLAENLGNFLSLKTGVVSPKQYFWHFQLILTAILPEPQKGIV